MRCFYGSAIPGSYGIEVAECHVKYVSKFDGAFAEETALPQLQQLLVPAVSHPLGLLRPLLLDLSDVDAHAKLVLHL